MEQIKLWQQGRTYQRGDLVMYAGACWRCKTEVVSHRAPTVPDPIWQPHAVPDKSLDDALGAMGGQRK